eukprot:2596148-Pyramimonas_sp.AAC.1
MSEYSRHGLYQRYHQPSQDWRAEYQRRRRSERANVATSMGGPRSLAHLVQRSQEGRDCNAAVERARGRAQDLGRLSWKARLAATIHEQVLFYPPDRYICVQELVWWKFLMEVAEVLCVSAAAEVPRQADD